MLIVGRPCPERQPQDRIAEGEELRPGRVQLEGSEGPARHPSQHFQESRFLKRVTSFEERDRTDLGSLSYLRALRAATASPSFSKGSWT